MDAKSIGTPQFMLQEKWRRASKQKAGVGFVGRRWLCGSFWFRFRFSDSSPSGGRSFGVRGCTRVERLRERCSVRSDTDEQFNPLLRLFERRVAGLEERDAALKSSERFFESDATVFEIGDDPLQLGKCGFEGRLVGVGRCGHRIAQWFSVDSTRLVSWPAARIVVIRSPIASWSDAVTRSPVSVRRVIE